MGRYTSILQRIVDFERGDAIADRVRAHVERVAEKASDDYDPDTSLSKEAKQAYEELLDELPEFPLDELVERVAVGAVTPAVKEHLIRRICEEHAAAVTRAIEEWQKRRLAAASQTQKELIEGAIGHLRDRLDEAEEQATTQEASPWLVDFILDLCSASCDAGPYDLNDLRNDLGMRLPRMWEC